ncbi:MAG: hypothetical protein WCT17_00445 [Bacilli bacterium]
MKIKYFLSLALTTILVACGGSNDIIKIKTAVFDNCLFTANYDSATEERNALFIAMFNEDEEGGDLINSFTSTKMNIDQQTDYVALRLGSSSSNGTLTLNTNYVVTKVKANVEAYYKYIEYSSSWSISTGAKLSINGEENTIDLSTDNTTARPGAEDFEINFDKKDNVKTLEFASIERVYIHSFEISYLIS